jgi:hypothetical protein
LHIYKNLKMADNGVGFTHASGNTSRSLLAQNVPIARQILRKVLEGRLVFVPRHENDEH